MARTKVLFISAVPDFKGGAEVVLQTMLANPHVEKVLAVPEDGPVAVAARRMGVAVCTYNPTALLRVHRPPRPGPMLAAVLDAVRCAARLRRLARAHGCAIMHSNGLKPHLLNALIRLMPGWRPRTLVHLHDIAYRGSERAIWRMLALCVDRVILVSRPCYPGATLPAKVKVVPNGIEPVCPALPATRQQRTLRLGFVGRFHPNKGMDVLLDWFAAIRRAGLDATLTIRGRPDPDVPEYWDRIRARINDEGLAPTVRDEGWVTGPDRFAGLDMLLVTSEVPDPAPLVVLEAMSAGVVVAGYPRGGIPWLLADGDAGLLAEDGETLARDLRAMLDQPGALDRVRWAAYERVRREFSIEGFHARLRAVYEALDTPP